MKKIIILCSRLDLPGGVERAVVNTANLFQQHGQQVILLVLDEAMKSFYPLHSSIAIHNLPIHFGIKEGHNPVGKKIAFLQHIRLLRKKIVLLQPDVVIATEYQHAIAGYLAAGRSKAKIFAWEHHHFYWLGRNRFWRFLFKKIYPKLDTVICLNSNEQKLFDQMGCRTSVIPNFVEKGPKAVLQNKSLLTVGWLIKRKGVDLIPAIAEKVFNRFPDWQWIIIGSGPEEETLKNSLAKKGLDTYVSIIKPLSPDLHSQYLQTSLYVMTSRFECFPMVLLEAMACGIPCISFDCATGPSSIIHHEVDGILIRDTDVDAMAASISDLVVNEEKRKAFGDNAYRNIERFSPAKVYRLWEELFTKSS